MKHRNNHLYRVHLGSAHLNKGPETTTPTKALFSTDAAPSILPDTSDANNFCCVCQNGWPTRTSYLSRLRIVHSMNSNYFRERSETVIINKEVIPDLDDPNFYCAGCEKKLSNRPTFRDHLARIHKMTFKPQGPNYLKKIVHADMTPDVGRSKLLLLPCEKTYPGRSLYRGHLPHEIHMK
jgi:hypothetical protein